MLLRPFRRTGGLLPWRCALAAYVLMGASSSKQHPRATTPSCATPASTAQADMPAVAAAVDMPAAELRTPSGHELPRPVHRQLHAHDLRPGRLVIVGDVHGCAHELRGLLLKVGFDRRADNLLLVGDLVNKGPRSREVRENEQGEVVIMGVGGWGAFLGWSSLRGARVTAAWCKALPLSMQGATLAAFQNVCAARHLQIHQPATLHAKSRRP